MKVQLDLEEVYKLITFLCNSNKLEKRENDISFKINGRFLPANSIILSQQSEILSKIIAFSATNIITLEDTNPDSFSIFLDYLHEYNNIFDLYSYSDQYTIISLKIHIIHFLQYNINLKTLLDIYNFLQIYDNEIDEESNKQILKLSKLYYYYLSNHCCDILDALNIESLPYELLIYILKVPAVNCPNEQYLLDKICLWFDKSHKSILSTSSINPVSKDNKINILSNQFIELLSYIQWNCIDNYENENPLHKSILSPLLLDHKTLFNEYHIIHRHYCNNFIRFLSDKIGRKTDIFKQINSGKNVVDICVLDNITCCFILDYNIYQIHCLNPSTNKISYYPIKNSFNTPYLLNRNNNLLKINQNEIFEIDIVYSTTTSLLPPSSKYSFLENSYSSVNHGNNTLFVLLKEDIKNKHVIGMYNLKVNEWKYSLNITNNSFQILNNPIDSNILYIICKDGLVLYYNIFNNSFNIIKPNPQINTEWSFILKIDNRNENDNENHILIVLCDEEGEWFCCDINDYDFYKLKWKRYKTKSNIRYYNENSRTLYYETIDDDYLSIYIDSRLNRCLLKL